MVHHKADYSPLLGFIGGVWAWLTHAITVDGLVQAVVYAAMATATGWAMGWLKEKLFPYRSYLERGRAEAPKPHPILPEKEVSDSSEEGGE